MLDKTDPAASPLTAAERDMCRHDFESLSVMLCWSLFSGIVVAVIFWVVSNGATVSTTGAVVSFAVAAVAFVSIVSWDRRRAMQYVQQLRLDARVDAISHPSCPAEVLESLVSDPQPAVREAVAEHPNVPELALRTLAHDECAGVRKRVATNPNSSDWVLLTLQSDRSPKVRKRLASNPACPAPVLVRLAADDDPLVRRAAVKHPNADAETVTAAVS